MESLISHLELGKPILNRSRKPITGTTVKKYRIWINKLDGWFNKDFDKVSETDIDRFRQQLKQDEIRNHASKPYSESTKRDIEQKFIKTLFDYLNKPELTRFLVTYKDDVEIPSIQKSEAYRIVNQSRLRDKVIFQLMFDGGFRASEFLSIRFKDIKDDELDKGGYYKIWIRKSKTIPRSVGLTLPESTEILQSWLEINKDKVGTEEPLIDLTYRHLNLIVSRISKKVLGKGITPHQLRHSSATYYCHYLSRYQMCKRYGWAMASDMVQRYIDREGVDDEQMNNKVVSEENLSFKKQVNILREQLNKKSERLQATEKRVDELAGMIKKLLVQEIKTKKDTLS